MGLTWLPFKPDGPAEENSMTGSFYKSWWREMGAISRGMMFVEGNIATPLSLQDNGRQARKPASEEQRPDVSGLKKTADRLYQDFLLLGGRPVTPQQRKTQQSQTCATC
jgi:hypothetical protein